MKEETQLKTLKRIMAAFEGSNSNRTTALLARALRAEVAYVTETYIPVRKRKVSDDPQYLTHNEVLIGCEQGKLPCVKHHKTRTGLLLMDSKRAVEAYFEKHGLVFYVEQRPTPTY